MLFLTDFLIALLVAALLVAIFGVGLRRDTGAGLLWFFILLLLATWAGGAWIGPVGPLIFGVSWLAYFLVGLIFALFVMALLPPVDERPTVTGTGAQAQWGAEAGAFVALNAFFWVLLAGLVIAVVVAYL